jgi:hypothetical protein
MAIVFGIEVLNQDKCHAGIFREMAKQLRECLQSAGRGAYPDDYRMRAGIAGLGRRGRDGWIGYRT